MEKKNVMRSLIMALLFFVMQTFCVVSAQADENELLTIKEIALEKIDEAFMEIAANEGEYKEPWRQLTVGIYNLPKALTIFPPQHFLIKYAI